MIAAALHAFAEASQRQFMQDRSQTVGASSVGRCARQTYFEKNEGDPVYGSPRDVGAPQRWGATLRGSMMENHFWEPALRAVFGDRLLFAGAAQRTLIDGFLSATPDGLLTGLAANALAELGVADIEGDCIAVEAKSVDPRTNMIEPKPENVFQVHVQLGLIRTLTPHRPTYGLLSYMDASFWDLTHEFPIRFDPEVFEEAKRRARDIMLARSPADLKAEGVIAGGKECELCAFTHACGVARTARVPASAKSVDPIMADTIAELALVARNARDLSAASMLSAKAQEEEVRALMAAAETRKLTHNGISISWSADADRLTIKRSAPAKAVEPSPVEAPNPGISTKAA